MKRQRRLQGIEDEEHKELRETAERLLDLRYKRKTYKIEEDVVVSMLLDQMRFLDKESIKMDGILIEVVDGKPKIKVERTVKFNVDEAR